MNETTATNATVPPVNTSVPNIPKKNNHTVLILVLLVIFVVTTLMIASGFFAYAFFVQSSKTAELIPIYVDKNASVATSLNSSSLTSTKSSSSSSSVSSIQYSTFDNEYISFKYPKGWKVTLNESDQTYPVAPVDNTCSSPNAGLKGIAAIDITSQNNQKISFSNTWIAMGSGSYKYTFSKPTVLTYYPEGSGDIVDFPVSNAKVLPLSFGGAFFSGEVTRDGKKTKLLLSIPAREIKSDSVAFSDEFDFAYFSSDSVLDKSMSQKLRYDGLYHCAKYSESGGVMYTGYATINDTPENVANIVDTFISSIVRKK
ncbi:MAG: hypothetical protein WCO33_03650 [bacterium]